MPADRPVVCGVADAATAAAVLAAGRRLVTAYGASLTVVHAFDEPVAAAEETMDAIRSATASDTDVEIRLVEGSPAEHLLQIAAVENADWLVVGARGRGALARSLGSVSRQLVQRAACPVVVVPEGADGEGAAGDAGESVVCGVDGSSHALAAARLAGELASHLGARVVVVHAPRTLRSLASYRGRETTPSWSVQPDAADRLTRDIVTDAIDAVGEATTRAVVEPGRPDQVLISVAERENAGMVVVAGRGTGAVGAMLLGSVAASLATSSPVPVVVVPEGAEGTWTHGSDPGART